MTKVMLLATVCLATVIQTVKSDQMQSFYDALPQNAKIPFLKYELALAALDDKRDYSDKKFPVFQIPETLGIPSNLIKEFQNLMVPTGFREHVYKWVQTRYGLERNQILQLAVRDLVCFPAGHPCFNVGDVGSNCC